MAERKKKTTEKAPVDIVHPFIAHPHASSRPRNLLVLISDSGL